MNKFKHFVVLILAIMISLNLFNIPYNVQAATNSGINLYPNEGFEENNEIKPFTKTVSNAFATCAIQKDIGVNGSNGLKLLSVLNHACCIENYFDVQARKSYRVWLTAKNGPESTSNYLGMGVRNYPDYKKSSANNWQGVLFTTQQYETKHIDFTVGDKDTKAKVYILVGQTIRKERGSAYIDDFVLEETASPPTINPIINPPEVTSITGTAKPGSEVKVTLGDSTVLTATTAPDGTYSVSFDAGSIGFGDNISAVQVGLYGIESVPTTYNVYSAATKHLGINLYDNPGFDTNGSISQLSPTQSEAFHSSSGIKEGIGVADPKTGEPTKGYEMLGDPYGAASSGNGLAVCLENYFPTNKHHSYRVWLTAKLGDKAKENLDLGIRFYRLAPPSEEDRKTVTFSTENFETKFMDFEVGDYKEVPETKVYILAGDAKGSSSTDDLRGHAIIDDFVLEKTAYPPTINPINDAVSETSISGTSEPGHDVTIRVIRNEDTALEEIILEQRVPTSEYSGIYSHSFEAGILKPGDTVKAIQHGLYDTDSYPATITAEDNVPPDPPEVIVIKDTDITIEGVAEANSTVKIKFPNDSKDYVTTTGENSNFTVDLEGKTLKAGEIATITATDAFGNTSGETKKTILSTANTTINAEDDLAIYGKNFAIKLSELDTLTDDIVKTKSGAKAITLSDETDVTSQVSVNRLAIENKLGVYPVILNMEQTNHTVLAFVVNDSFTLDEEKDVIITGNDFSFWKGALANLTESTALQHSMARAWKLSDGSSLTSSLKVNNLDTVEETVKDYNVDLVIDGINDVSHSITITITELDTNPPIITDIEVTYPEDYTNTINSWSNEDIILKISAIDDAGIDTTSYKVSFDDEQDDEQNWESDGFTDKTTSGATLTISTNGYDQKIRVTVSDIADTPNESVPAKMSLLNIDKVKPTTNYENGKIYNTDDVTSITFGDEVDGSGIYSATINDRDIVSGVTTPDSGSNTITITDKAGNVTEVIFVVSNADSQVKITGVILKDDAEVGTIERGSIVNSLAITPEISVILKNLDTGNEYIGILSHGKTLVFKGIDLGEYEITSVNPPDIAFKNTNMTNNKFELTAIDNEEEIIITSEFVDLRGFGTIKENND